MWAELSMAVYVKSLLLTRGFLSVSVSGAGGGLRVNAALLRGGQLHPLQFLSAYAL